MFITVGIYIFKSEGILIIQNLIYDYHNHECCD